MNINDEEHTSVLCFSFGWISSDEKLVLGKHGKKHMNQQNLELRVLRLQPEYRQIDQPGPTGYDFTHQKQSVSSNYTHRLNL